MSDPSPTAQEYDYIADMVYSSDSATLKKMADDMWLKENPEFRSRPAGVIEFIIDSKYLGLEDVFANVIVECEKILEGKDGNGYTELIDYEGIGAGKTYKAQILLLYKCHLLLCLKKPHRYLGISNDKYITLLNMGLSLIQARGVFFEGMTSMVMESPFFKQFNMEVLATEIRFKKDKIKLVCGSSSKTIALGLNVFAAVLDEAAFYNESMRSRRASNVAEAMDQAEVMYNQIKRRITSRFKKTSESKVKPLLAMISSPKHEEDFMNKKIKEFKQMEINGMPLLGTYIINLPTWIAKDRHKMNRDVFVFDKETFRVLNQNEIENYPMDKKIYDVTPNEWNIDILKYNNKLDERLWIIPIDFQEDFQRAPELSARDYGAIPTSTIERFYRRPDEIEKCMYIEIENRFESKSSLNDFQIENPPDDMVFISVDLGLNKIRSDGSRGDFAGIAICHFGGYDMEHGGRPVIVFDAVARVGAGDAREIDFGEIRDLVIRMKEKGWNVYKVTYDSWQSLDSIQTLRKKGIVCDILSTDRTSEPHETLKAAIYEGRAFLPFNEVLLTELKQLERIATSDKIDHPRYGSKDVADAVSCAAYNCVKFNGTKHTGVPQYENDRQVNEQHEGVNVAN